MSALKFGIDIDAYIIQMELESNCKMTIFNLKINKGDDTQLAHKVIVK